MKPSSSSTNNATEISENSVVKIAKTTIENEFYNDDKGSINTSSKEINNVQNFSTLNKKIPLASQKYIITPEFILSWIQKYRRPTNEVPPKLIVTYGKDFKFLGREETAEQLWNGTLNKNGVKKRYYAHQNKIKDCNFHPIPFIAAGWTTSLEFFYQQCSEYAVNTVDFLQVMTDVCVLLLNEHYELEEFTHDNSDIIAGCLLDEMMILDERIKELKQYGIVVLEEAHNYPGHVYLHLPYIMIWCIARVSNKSNKLYQFWKPMIESDELFLWQNWEDFNVRFLALKFCLLSVYGYKEIKACDFLKNAYCGDIIKNITIKIPDWKDVEVCFIKERFPVNGSWTVIDMYSNEKLFIKEKKLTVYKNGESAPFDGFSYIQLKTTNNKDAIMACLQTKWRKLETVQPQKITANMITKEYESTKKTLIDKLNLQDNDFIFILLSICPLSEEIDLGTMSKDVKNAALICKNNFCDFYAQEKVNVNTAKFWELRLINGVGEILANDIVEKCKRDHFVDEDDLCRCTKFPKHAVSLVKFK
nr:15531_t:CDS:2 [Entrophospora candida]